MPVLARGERFIYAQSQKEIVAFLGLAESAGPALSPLQLRDRLDKFMSASIELLPLMPADRLATHVPGRPRSYRELGHHMFKVVDAFLDADGGATLVREVFADSPPEDTSTAQLVAHADAVRARFRGWWETGADRSGAKTLSTYYGAQSLHELLERTTWHHGQHARQWMMLLEREGVAHHRPLVDSDFTDLPMPTNVWDG
ncbi:MAG: hypothetical protein IPK81_19520 [Rhodospirillales bacterium]|nr:MAG: hypothetical protein IPK81_19520 [Rhodospirillales bacterium]